MANIIKNNEHTNITLVILGIDESKALTTNFKPSFLLIILNGLKARKALKALNALKAFREVNFPLLPPVLAK